MDNNVSTSGDTTATSGAVDGQIAQTEVDSSQDTSGSSEGTIPKSHLEKVLKEKRNLSAKLAELENAIKSREEQDMLANNQHKEVADLHREENRKLKAELEAREQMLVKAKKVSALKKHLVQMGLNTQYEELVLNKLVDVDDLVIDPETGAVLGAEDKAKRVRQDFAGLGGLFGGNVHRVDQSAPVGQAASKPIQQMTQEEIRAQLKALEGR